MSGTSWLQFAALIAVLLLTAPALGGYLAKIYGDEAKKPGDRVFGPIERVIYQVCRVDPGSEQRWSTYALSVLAFSVMSFLLLYGIARFQGVLPFNPTDKPAVTDHVAFNAAVSFMTNTNWQSYSGEATMSHFTQMTGLAVQNFVSASAGMCVLAALIRGLARKRASALGNFWVDLARTVLRIMFPLSFVVAILLVSQGVIQNLHGFIVANTLEGAPQLIPGGPVASQVAIKQLGTNGGGFFNVNSAHPFENYTPIGNFVENWAILIIPFALCFAFGKMVHDRRQGWAVLAIMGIIWIGMSVAAMSFEAKGNPRLDALGVTQQTTVDQSGGNLEGKEVRFGVGASGLWAASTTGTSNGSVNSMHDSYTPLGGMVPLAHMMLGEVSPGGTGVGLNGLLVMAILAVFIAGLMVGRTPEYLGKKIQATEMKLVTLYILAMPIALLSFAAASVLISSALASRNNPGPHGLSEILYAYTSGANNNGSAFAGLTASTWSYDTTIGVAMLIGRFFLIIPVLAIAGSLARKGTTPVTAATFPTHKPLFVGLVIGVVLIVGGLTFFPALALGPIVEQLSTQ
ncbi:potassium-transporting ATPase subunit KdpA [Mycobacterium tuberculosis variant bovis]|uniref:potassium-transporting ATPase subunit KdpA n=1 Tax=Mycobacterium tuberculosis TaxID=1773 RepID=UPI00084B428A|nr:potassium-transporting ATPase subunit KdpA [Mycobacterium tuberculosis]ODW05979.1 potassium-transporting ATPase subunit KdpA [Mycobacterium tuberculosis variant bovis]WCR94327.1 potassium-transporting ATPase subunit KdpA [Mycobacterium tuberculosis variant bovis]